MNNRTISKGFLITAIVSGLVMAWFGFQDSFSQNALQEYDGLLRVYLGCGSLAMAFITATAMNRNEMLTIIKPKVQWGYVYLSLAVFFLFVSATNVSQLYIWHLIATGLVAATGYIISWNYFTTKWKRTFSILFNTLALVFFISTWLFGVATIAWGEVAISFAVLVVLWVIINEKVNK